MLEIRLLGDFAFLRDGFPVTGLDSPRLQALLAYLLLHRHAPQLRQHLAFLFWMDSDEAQARTNLRNLLHRLRQAWPETDHYLAIETKSIRWRPDAHFTLDVADFEVHLQRAYAVVGTSDEHIAHLQKAINLYHSDLLPACYADWIRPERERLRQAFLQALEELSNRLRDQGNYQAAIHASQRLLQAEPLQEVAYRQLMDLHSHNGDRAAALSVYHQCVRTLRQELGLPPDPATQAAYRDLLMPGVAAKNLPLPSVRRDAPLVGRDGEWQQLMLAWRQMAAGNRPPFIALIRGEAGIGKTRLAAEVTDWVSRQGLTVASTACYAPEVDLSLVPVVGWLRTLPLNDLAPVWRSELARLLPELSGPASSSMDQKSGAKARAELAAEPWQKRRFYEALARAVLVQKQPLLLRLEDVHWADAETLAWLHYLLRLDANARLMVVATLRDNDADLAPPLVLLLAALHQQGRLLEIDIAPLDGAGTGTLATMLLGEALPPEAVAALYRHTQGNPLFIIETLCRDLVCGESASTLHTLLEASQVPEWDEQIPFSPKIQAVLHDRLAQLSPEAYKFLEVASAMGRSFTTELLSHAFDLQEDEWMTALDELWRRRIVTTRDGEAYDFSHDLLRQVIYTALSPARRRWLHGRVARAMESIDQAESKEWVGHLALHYEAAGQPRKALRAHRQAAESARRLYAFPAAAFHLQRAIALLDRVPQDRVPQDRDLHSLLHEHLGDIHQLAGRQDEARQAFHTAIAAIHPDRVLDQAAVMLKLAQTWLSQYSLDEAWSAFEAVSEKLGNPAGFTPTHWPSWLDARLGQLDVLYYRADTERMATLIDETGPPLERYGSLRQLANYHLMRVELESRQTRYCLGPEAVATCRTAANLALGSGDEHLYQRSRFGLGFVLLWSGAVNLAAEELADVADKSRTVGNIPLLDRSLAYLVTAYRLLGQLDRVQDLLPHCLAVAEEENNPLYLAVARANQAWLSYRAGAYDKAVAHARFALEQWEKFVFPFHWLARWPLLAIALERGDLVTAVAQAQALLMPEQHKLPPNVQAALTRALAIRRDNADEVSAVLNEAVRFARQIGQL